MNIFHFSKIRFNTVHIDNHILYNSRIITIKILGYNIMFIPQYGFRETQCILTIIT